MTLHEPPRDDDDTKPIVTIDPDFDAVQQTIGTLLNRIDFLEGVIIQIAKDYYNVENAQRVTRLADGFTKHS